MAAVLAVAVVQRMAVEDVTAAKELVLCVIEMEGRVESQQPWWWWLVSPTVRAVDDSQEKHEEHLMSKSLLVQTPVVGERQVWRISGTPRRDAAIFDRNS